MRLGNNFEEDEAAEAEDRQEQDCASMRLAALLVLPLAAIVKSGLMRIGRKPKANAQV